MKANYVYPYRCILYGLLCSLALSSCTKDPLYKEYLKQTEKVYLGRPDSVSVRAGLNRARILSFLTADARVTRIRIYWNSRRDSVEAEVSQADYYKFKPVNIPNLSEGVYTFQLATLDNVGHRSVLSEAVGRVYGTNYINSLGNRAVQTILSSGGIKTINWFAETDAESIIVGGKVTYPKIGGDSITVSLPKSVNQTTLTNGLGSGKLTIRTAYLPVNSIDTLYARSTVISY